MNTQEFLKELSLFKGREERLRKIKRYSIYHTMWYRTDLWIHTRRVAWIVEELIPLAKEVFQKSFDPEKAIALALVHDDAEMIFGDIQAGNKTKMTEGQLKEIDRLERKAIENLAKQYPLNLGGYIYKELLLESINKTSLESILVNWADKYDAFCEALHELYANHKLWSLNVENEYGKIDLPTEHYMIYFSTFSNKFPKSIELFVKKNSWFTIPDKPKIPDIMSYGAEHTRESLELKKGYQPYDQWIALTLKKGNEEDVSNLYIRKE